MVNSEYLFVGLFALDFLIVGIVSTMAMNPLLGFKEIIRKLSHIIPLGLMFSILSTGIIYIRHMTASSILIVLSIISLIIIIIVYIRKQSTIHKIENPEEYTEKHILRILYVLIILCIVSYIGMEVPPFSVNPLWFGLCIPFIAFIPGYLCLNIINPYKDEIRITERVWISIFLSLVITSIIGLILVQIEHLLNMRHVSLILVVVTLIVLIPVYYIRIKEKKTFVLFSSSTVNKIFIIITILAIIAVISSGVLVKNGNTNVNNEEKLFVQGNTTFEVSGIHTTPDSDGYYNFSNEEILNLNVDIKNDEHKDMAYKLKIEIINDTSNSTFSEEEIKVNENENKTIEKNITMETGKKDIRFILYDNNNNPYKIRHLYVNVNENLE
ncbi:MAG: DUF1616 domain-containing protein [Methanosphaera sp.]|nr:DUF1616 domain-containing protein [Methanosphaera sp.]